MSIKQLPTQLANQIAAGEVVERPSSVVKELIENSLDAGATNIEIEIEKGGHKRIKIRDNGAGIEKDELALALAPHSTSKIETLEDLENIASLGFRGEALASISSVSRLTLTSKPSAQNEAWSAITQGREMKVSLQPTAHPNGTTIDVCDLFYNTPARRKFLRAEKTEFQHIDDIVKRIALSRPRIAFLLKHNQKVVRRWSSGKSSQQYENEEKRIAQVCGNNFVQRARYVTLNYDGTNLQAWVGDRSLMRSATDMQFCFVNGRAMRDKLLLHAIRQAYETIYSELEQPSYVVFLELNPNDVDVNVHPAKHEVRFHQSRQVHDLVCKAFQDALCEQSEDTGMRENDGGSDTRTGITTHGEVNSRFSDQTPSHDYIQPLQSATKNAAHVRGVSEKYNQSLSTINRAQRVPKLDGQSATPSRVATQAYTQLMSSQEATSTGFVAMQDEGILSINDSLKWIPIETLLELWVLDKIGAASIPQPLLMPVAVDCSSTQKESLQPVVIALTRQHFHVRLVSNKCILQQVPATLRNLPWGRLFPAFCECVLLGNEGDMCRFIAANKDLLNEEPFQCIHWFLHLDTDKQHDLLLSQNKHITTKNIESFVQWINS